jgi:uncharacterized membrane protein YjjP (DUF1212 family)
MIKTRKFIAIATVICWLLFTAYLLVVASFFPVQNLDLLQLIWGGFTGFVGLVVGFYFGKSTAIEGVNDGSAINKEDKTDGE